jgi:WD40 repeat protein
MIGALLVLCSMALALGSAESSPMLLPSPTLTAPPFTPPPTPLPTWTPAPFVLSWPPLQPITAQNVAQLVPLVSLQCPNPETAPNRIRSILWSPARSQLAVLMSRNMCLYDLETPNTAPLVMDSHDAWNGAFSLDGSDLATVHNGSIHVRIWDALTGDTRDTAMAASFNSDNPNPTIAYSPDGKLGMANTSSRLAATGLVCGHSSMARVCIRMQHSPLCFRIHSIAMRRY